MSIVLKSTFATGVFLAALSLSMVAQAQANPPASQTASAEQANDPVDVGDIIVTAQRREERLQDVPLAVSVVTGSALANQQINDTNNLAKAVPSLTFQSGNNPIANSFRIRGVGTALFSQGVEPSVAVVVDGVVQARQAQNFSSLADIERIEILRGPQGTLFGKNATAGVINVVTARPTDYFQAKANFSVAEEDEYRASGSISGPLTDTLRARLTGFYNDVGGYHTNAANGTEEGASTGWGLRGKLDWDVTSALNILAIAEIRNEDADCCQYALVNVQSPVRGALYGGAGVPIEADSDYVWNSGRSYAESDQATFSVEAGLDLGWAKVTSITAFQHFKVDSNFEGDRLGSSVPIFLSATSNAQYDYNFGIIDTKQFSQEVRIDSQGDGPITYTAGLYYSKLDLGRYGERRRAVCTSGVVGQPCAPANIRYQSLITDADLANEHYSVFGQVEAEVLPGLKLIGGLRALHESVEVNGAQIGVLVAGDTAFGTLSPSGRTADDDSALIGKAGAQYQFSERAQMYATYTRGYKGKGVDTEITTNFSNNPVIQPEKVDAYEIGFKGSFFDGRLSTAFAVFQSDYANLQVQANRSDPTTGVVSFQATNAGSSRTRGFEIEATARVASGFTVKSGLTFLDPSLNADGLNCPIQFQSAAVTVPVGGTRPENTCYRYQYLDSAGNLLTSGLGQNVRDGETPASPHWRVSFSPRYEMEMGRFRGFGQIDVSYQSAQQFAIEQDPNQIQRAYTIVNASVGVRNPDGRYTLTFFAKNLFDQNYYSTSQGSNLLPSNLNLVDRFAVRPKDADRYVGASLGLSF